MPDELNSLAEDLPEDSLPPSDQDDALALDQVPAADDVEAVLEQPPPPPLGLSWAFDFSRGPAASGGFVTSPFPGRGSGPVETRGDATLRGWIEKCLRTAQGAHPVYPDAFGMERPWDVVGGNLRQAVASDLQRRVREALTFHPRIVAIRDFSIGEAAEDPEALAISFTVVKDDEATMRLEALTLG